ncbi:hypothetical protein [Thermoflexus hugenholtzii]|uniref:Uncharacterized protein n=1 Tax=Thermoflexus hugenholtzii JAD2 TaxID=877466 RepID=A0A212QS26_9CHLR|nr:hypothetical protein [Thermoflexus hugenholtzii]SNB62390.1 hypothetical protein SAMN02746019_00005060 [Thermoflexus hugenholtzii JAD2]
MTRRLRQILIAGKAWEWSRGGRWALAVLLALAVGLSEPPHPGVSRYLLYLPVILKTR